MTTLLAKNKRKRSGHTSAHYNYSDSSKRGVIALRARWYVTGTHEHLLEIDLVGPGVVRVGWLGEPVGAYMMNFLKGFHHD